MQHIEHALKQYFGYDAFLAGQRQVIELVLAGRDMLVLMPTGGGKSLTYQLPALLLPGLTIVVSPLIALMQDQVDRLQANGIPATFINSSLSEKERHQRERDVLNGDLKLLYVAPERLLTQNFLVFLDELEERMGLSLLAVDEAHCVSEWGHDFRPEYRQLSRLRVRYAQTPMLALTATATERVQQDILEQLKLRDPHLHVASFNRPNLYYEVRQKNQRSYREVLQLLGEMPGQSVIIYCQSRQGVENLCADLQRDGIDALPYHAGLPAEVRSENQSRFIRDDVPVLVATIAFGMGIAKPDVRAVIHYDLPRNLEGYYQESGRAGRDSQPARCILFFNYGERMRSEYLIGQRVASEEMQMIALEQLQQAVAYCETQTCRRAILLRYFGEEVYEENCGNCDNCLRPVEYEDHTVNAQKFLSCIGRTRERFGMRHIVDVLRGANTQRIRDYGHNQLSTYGIGKDLSADEWMLLGRSLMQQGLLSQSTDGYPVPRLNALSKEILRGQRDVSIPAIKSLHVQQERREKPAVAELDPASQGLFHHLRALRKEIADEQGVAPYVVFSDATLLALARHRPQSEEQFASIPGIGSRKLEAYFTPFTRAIQDYCEQNDLAMGLDLEVKARQRESGPPATGAGTARRVTLDLYNQGYSIEEIATERSIKPDTVIGYLADLIEAGEAIDVNSLLQPGHYDTIVAAIEQVGAETLKPIKEYLGDDYSYGEIRLVRSMLRASQLPQT